MLVVMRGWWWRGCMGAGVFLGLAMMSKGPVALLQSVLPFAAFAVYAHLVGVELPERASRPTRSGRALSVLLGVGLLLAIALPWPIYVMLTVPDAMHKWIEDIFYAPGTSDRQARWWGYFWLVPNLVPWIPLFIAGLCLPFLSRYRRKPINLAWFLFVTPIVVMSFVRDKNERYGLPMVPAAALLCGYIAVELIVNRAKLNRADRIVVFMQWAVAAGVALVILAGALPLFGPQREVWFGWPYAIGMFSIAAAIFVVALVLRPRIRWIAIPAMAAVSLIMYRAAVTGYSASVDGAPHYKAAMIRASIEFPDAQFLFCDPRPDGRHVPPDMSIYGNRPVHGTILADLHDSPRRQVLFVLRQKGDGDLDIPGWKFLRREPVEKRSCGVYLREPAEDVRGQNHLKDADAG
jgi:4-amino-4-deoxy-L-arabinose transferase-like glycosyltransferase